MAGADKRKADTGQEDVHRSKFFKKAKSGTGGKWKMPHYRPKAGEIQPGDQGVWATCAKGQELRASDELLSMFEDCAHRFYGLPASDDEAEGDIEASIQKEVTALSSKEHIFTPIRVDMQCVIFFKSRAPIDPVEFVHTICQEVATTPGIRRLKYVNRLTPMSAICKATMTDLESMAKILIDKDLKLVGEEGSDAEESTYAIRPSFRNHNTLRRDDVIKTLASLVGPKHKVDLTHPDKVIIVEIYRTICGISIVNGDWESLKRFNLSELYARNNSGAPTPKPRVHKDDTRAAQI